MAKNETILRFEDVSFEYNTNKPILEEVSLCVAKARSPSWDKMVQAKVQSSDLSLEF